MTKPKASHASLEGPTVSPGTGRRAAAVGRRLLAAAVGTLAPVAGVFCLVGLQGSGLPGRLVAGLAVGVLAFMVLRGFRLVDPRSNSLGSLLGGLLSPVLAGGLGIMTYASLTQASADRDADFAFRLTATAVAMTLPFLATAAIASFDRRRRPLGLAGKAGVALAAASLALTWVPINGLRARLQQAENLALTGVEAPPFDTADLDGRRQRLSDHGGKVVLVNVWATWCGPCRLEMPQLDRLYQSRRAEGLVVFGLSTEDVELQKQFAEDLPVSYPLLTTQGEVPGLYSQTARYPANFLIDRQGRLHPAPSADAPFSELEEAVDGLLAAGPGATEPDPPGNR